MTIIERLREHLKKTGVKLPVVVKATGIPTERIRKWLEGKGNPKSEDTLTLEKYLGVDKVTEEIPTAVKDSYLNPYPFLDKDQIIALYQKEITRLEMETINSNDLRGRLAAIEETLKRIEELVGQPSAEAPEKGFVRSYKQRSRGG